MAIIVKAGELIRNWWVIPSSGRNIQALVLVYSAAILAGALVEVFF